MTQQPDVEIAMVEFARLQTEMIADKGTTEGILSEGRPVVLLTTRGARSGKLRSTPLMRVEHDGKYAIVGSKAAMPRQPDWYYNIKANPEVFLQDGAEPVRFVAREVESDEREEWWQRAVDAYPPYAEMQKRTDRQIPVIVLSRI